VSVSCYPHFIVELHHPIPTGDKSLICGGNLLTFFKCSFSQQLLPKEIMYFNPQTLQAAGSDSLIFKPASQHCMLCSAKPLFVFADVVELNALLLLVDVPM